MPVQESEFVMKKMSAGDSKSGFRVRLTSWCGVLCLLHDSRPVASRGSIYEIRIRDRGLRPQQNRWRENHAATFIDDEGVATEELRPGLILNYSKRVCKEGRRNNQEEVVGGINRRQMIGYGAIEKAVQARVMAVFELEEPVVQSGNVDALFDAMQNAARRSASCWNMLAGTA